MKKVLFLLSAFTLSSSIGYGACDFKTGIKPLPSGAFEYTEDCHVKVGEMKRDLDIGQKQVTELNLAITKKDEVISIADQRIANWRDTAYKMDDKLTRFDELRSQNQWLYFGLGVITAVASGYMASQLIK